MIPNLQQVSLSPIAIAGSGLWAIALYWGFYPTGQALIQRLVTWLGVKQTKVPNSGQGWWG